MVRLTTSATAAGVRITVADNGPGMSAEDRERAFLRFTTSSPNGTGLGLAIVHRLAISNGGTARLDETPGGGLTVTLDFPGVPRAQWQRPRQHFSARRRYQPVGKHQDARQEAAAVCLAGQECHHVRVPIRQRAGQIDACPLPRRDNRA